MKGPVEKKIEPFFSGCWTSVKHFIRNFFWEFLIVERCENQNFYSILSMRNVCTQTEKGQIQKRSQQTSFVLMEKNIFKKICSWLEAVLCPQSSQEKKLKEKEKINFFSKMRECDIVVGTLLFFSQKKISCNKWPKNTTSKEREKKSQKKIDFTNWRISPKITTHKKEWICQSNLRFTVPTISW